MDAEVSRRKFAKAISAMTGDASEFMKLRGWKVKAEEYPVLTLLFKHPTTGREVGFRFLCDNWDELPPSLTLVDPEDGSELPWEKWPQGGWNAGNQHPRTNKPFLCLPGIREYHTHDSHLNDLWENLRCRESYSLLHIVERVRQKFEVTNG